MKVILNQDVNNLGEEGDVVTVRDGYGRNYLLPTKAAMPYTPGNLAMVKARAAAIEKRKAEKRAASASLKEKLDGMTITLVVSAGESGKLFGSVTSQMVQDALAKQGVNLERKKLEVPTHAIKQTGKYEVRAHLYENDFSMITLLVKSEAELKAEQKAAEEAAAKAAAEAKKAEEAQKAAEEAQKAAEEAAKAEEEPKAEEASEEPKAEEAQAEEPKAEELQTEEPKAEEAAAEEPKADAEEQPAGEAN